MRLALLSDVHGNLPALEKVLEHLGSQTVDRVVFLGDAVGYGPWPEECVERLRQVCGVMIRGNHDSALLDKRSFEDLNPLAAAAMEWTRRRVAPDTANMLASLPLTYDLEGTLLVHGSPHEPDRWHYIVDQTSAREAFSAVRHRIILVGHSHFPSVFTLMDEEVSGLPLHEGRFELGQGRYILNPGSVGQPRDGDPRASYGVLDTEAGTFEVHRVPYDIEKVAKEIVNSGLPYYLGERLRLGY